MKKRYVVVTGAAGGIGRATANFFAKKGWIVVGIDRASFDGDFPQNGLFIQADVSLEKDWQDIHGKLAERTSSLDALVNNAAIQVAKPIVETTVEEWDLVLNANLRSVFLSVKMLYPELKAEDGGAIVNVSSVHAVATGAVDTPMLKAGLSRDHAGSGTPAERLENLARRTVSGKIGKPEEIARAIYFLADQSESSFITGQPLVVDGGATARLSTE